jgi:hypothetical protein
MERAAEAPRGHRVGDALWAAASPPGEGMGAQVARDADFR